MAGEGGEGENPLMAGEGENPLMAPAFVYPWTSPPTSSEAAWNTLYSLSGVPDAQEGLAALQRGEYLQGIGHLGASAASVGGMVAPAEGALRAIAGRVAGTLPLDAGIFAGRKAAERLGLNYLPQYEKGSPAAMMDPNDIGVMDQGPAAFWGVDKQPRFTIPDEGAILAQGVGVEQHPSLKDWRTNEPYVQVRGAGESKNWRNGTPWPKLQDVLIHPELYDAYPELRDYTVRSTSLGDVLTGAKGWMNPSGKTIAVGAAAPEDFLSTLLHEVQHAVQHREGFARGGSPSEFLPQGFADTIRASKLAHEDSLDKAAEQYGVDPEHLTTYLERDRYPGNYQMDHARADAAWSKIPEGEQFMLEHYYNVHQGNLNRQGEAFDKYRRLAGEVESRTVQEQLAQRDWSRLPHEMEGYVPTADQLVRYHTEPVDHNPFGDPQ